MTKRIKMTIEYDGSLFSGFQVQPDKRTVQGELEKAIFLLIGEKVNILASGRTDAGVHALGQVLHFDCNSKLPAEKIGFGLNKILPTDIMIKSAEDVTEEFDSRFSVHQKTYMLKFYLSRFERPHCKGKMLRVNDNVDVEAMKEAAKHFVGTYDFKSFVARKSGKTDFVRTIYESKIESMGNDEYAFVVCGNGFLYNMVRIMFGTLLLVGSHKIKPADINKIIEAKDRTKAGKTVSPEGLYLVSVKY